MRRYFVRLLRILVCAPVLLAAAGPLFGAPMRGSPEPACTAHQLEARFVDRDSGPADTLLVLRNLDAQACQINTLPPLVFYDGNGEQRLIELHYPVHPSMTTVTMAPGYAVSARLTWEERDIDHTHNCITPLMAAVSLPGGALRVLFGCQMCATGGSLVALTQWPLASWHTPEASTTP